MRLEYILCIMLYADVKLYVYIGSVVPPYFMKGHIVTGHIAGSVYEQPELAYNETCWLCSYDGTVL